MISDMTPSYITAVAISPNRRIFASSYENGTIKLWNLSTAQLLYVALDVGPVLTFSPDGQQIVSAAGEEIKIWKIEGLS
jgi:WD40 repeat protein